MSSVTRQLNAIDPDLPEALYQELYQCAKRELRNRRSPTLDTVGLVNEAWLKLGERPHWQNRAHFVGTMVCVMRHVLVDRARQRLAQKRGGDQLRVTLDEHLRSSADQAVELVAIDQAMQRLAEVDKRLERVAELRFFGGLEVKEVAELLTVSEATIKRDARLAKAFLSAELESVT